MTATMPEALTHGYQSYGDELLVDPFQVLIQQREVGRRAFRASPELCGEVIGLATRGYDVGFTAPEDREGLSPEENRAAAAYIADLEARADGGEGARAFLANPTVAVWNQLKMRAISLHPLYHARTIQKLGDGIDPTIYNEPLFTQPDRATVSANQLLRQQMADNPGEAERIIANYQVFIGQPIDEQSRLIWGASLDGRGVRTRAYEAVKLASQNFEDENGRIARNDLRLASFACGAAGPMSELVSLIQQKGGDVAQVNLVDWDAMALATGVSVMNPVAEKLRLHIQNLMRGETTDYLGPHSIDIADLLGLFEYFSDGSAVRLLQRVAPAMRPGGMIVFGNMVRDREQLTFFNRVVEWPKLRQRTISETLQLIEAAGFNPRDVSVRVPAREGLYAVYAVRVPASSQQNALVPRQAGRLVTAAAA